MQGLQLSRAGPWEAPELRQNAQEMSKGHILDVASFLDLSAVRGRNVKRPVSSEPILIRAEALHAVTPPYSSSFLGINESASVLPLFLPGSIQGLPNQAHSFISLCVPFFKSFS